MRINWSREDFLPDGYCRYLSKMFHLKLLRLVAALAVGRHPDLPRYVAAPSTTRTPRECALAVAIFLVVKNFLSSEKMVCANSIVKSIAEQNPIARNIRRSASDSLEYQNWNSVARRWVIRGNGRLPDKARGVIKFHRIVECVGFDRDHKFHFHLLRRAAALAVGRHPILILTLFPLVLGLPAAFAEFESGLPSLFSGGDESESIVG